MMTSRGGTVARGIAIALASTLLIAAPPRGIGAHAARLHTAPLVPGGVTTTRREVALSFDDGPSAYTPAILATLHALHVPATFFVVGREVRLLPATVRTEVAAGNEIGNHTFDHAYLPMLPNAIVGAELRETQDAVQSAARVKPRWLRPPYGAVDARVVAVASGLGLRTILWNVDPRDWTRPGVYAIVSRVLMQVRPGSVIILHDGGGDRSQTAVALPAIIRALRAQHYRFLTVSALFGLPGGSPCSGRSAARWFASAGIAARPRHTLYRAWLDEYCQGINLGPATSAEYRLGSSTVAEDFAWTAHRLDWVPRSGAVHLTIEWGWAVQVFSQQGIAPRWHTPITRAWFDQYLHGHDWGPARAAPQGGRGLRWQCFLLGCARLRRGAVTWVQTRSN